MSEIDQQFIEYVVKSLVGKPEAVQIERTIDEKGVLLKLTVDPDDLGRVIGKRGATAQSLRTLLRALGTKNDARYNLKIVDNGPDDGPQASNNEPSSEPAGDDKTDAPAPAVDDSAAATDNDSDQQQTQESAEEPEQPEPEVQADQEPEPVEEDSSSPEDEAGDRLARARKELADLDDLDV